MEALAGGFRANSKQQLPKQGLKAISQIIGSYHSPPSIDLKMPPELFALARPHRLVSDVPKRPLSLSLKRMLLPPRRCFSNLNDSASTSPQSLDLRHGQTIFFTACQPALQIGISSSPHMAMAHFLLISMQRSHAAPGPRDAVAWHQSSLHSLGSPKTGVTGMA